MNSIETIETLTFDEFFELCNTYRIFRKRQDDEYVVLITSIKNNNRWFSAFNEKNIFIHGVDWEYYSKGDAKYGISYEVVENIFQSQIGLNIYAQNKEPHFHMEPLGCINDMCINKSDVMFKLRTAYICNSCIDWAIKKKINPHILYQTKELIDSLRNELVNSNRISSTIKPLLVHVDPERKIKVGDQEINIVALQKVLFIFFLNHPKGVKTKLVSKHQNELFKIYKEIRQSGVEERIKRMFDSEKKADPSFDSHKSKLNKKLVKILGARLAEYYIITKVILKDDINLYKINIEEKYVKVDPVA
jgi:hypothetical protein